MHYQSAIDFSQVLIADFETTSVLHDLRTDVVQVLPSQLVSFLHAHQHEGFDEAALKSALGELSFGTSLLTELARQNIIKPYHES